MIKFRVRHESSIPRRRIFEGRHLSSAGHPGLFDHVLLLFVTQGLQGYRAGVLDSSCLTYLCVLGFTLLSEVTFVRTQTHEDTQTIDVELPISPVIQLGLN